MSLGVKRRREEKKKGKKTGKEKELALCFGYCAMFLGNYKEDWIKKSYFRDIVGFSGCTAGVRSWLRQPKCYRSWVISRY